MKKSLRILSMVLAVVMIFGSMSVMASAYAKYKGNDITTSDVGFDDVDIPTFTVDQYASMALDELDRMLAKANLDLDIYIGRLSLTSVDGTVKSINDLLGSAAVQNLLDAQLLGDAAAIVPAVEHTIKNTKRSNAGGDLKVIWDVLDLLGQLKGTARDDAKGETGILYKYVMGTVSLGALDGFIADYKFNVRELVIGLLYGLTGFGGDDYDYMESRSVPTEYTQTNGPLKLLQEVLNKYVLGEWKKLDDLFYGPNNTQSNVVYSEYEFHQGSASGALVTDDEPDTSAYDYYGYVHPDRWVTQTLGDAIRVAEGAAEPTASYTRVDIYNMCVANNGAGIPTYDFVEPLLLYAYNNIAVPVLNRITKRWLREKLGYYFDPAKTEEWATDENGQPVYDEETGERVRSSTFDYMYMGEEPEGGINTDSRIFELFDVDTFEVPRVSLDGYEDPKFIPNLNRNATQILPKVLKADITKNGGTYNVGDALADGDVLKFTWNGQNSDGIDVSYYFNWTYGANSLITDNAVNVVRFILQVTENEFFSDLLVEKGVVKTPTDLQTMDKQPLLSYVLRSVINANVENMWIDETDETRTIAGVGFEAVRQLAYQDIPQFTYTRPAGDDSQALVEKALAILMDVAAYKLNAELDTNIDASGTGLVNNGSTNNTGLVGYLGDSGQYGTTAATIAKWAVKTYTDTQYGNILAGIVPQLLTSATENSLWNDLDTVINAIIPIKANSTPWISGEIAGETQVVKSLIFKYLLYPIVNLDFTNIFKIFDTNDSGAFASQSIEKVLVYTVKRVFDLLFPNVFKNSINSVDTLLNNQNLAQMISDLACTLSATDSYTGLANTVTITGRGKTIAEFALPIVCMILGLSDTQEFHELENYIPDVIQAGEPTTFLIYNGSSGVNTSYKNNNGDRIIDKLYTYRITGAAAVVVGTDTPVTITNLTNYDLAAGASKEVTVSGYSNGQMLAITFEYKILDENGNVLKKPGSSDDATLTSKKYVYVTNDAEGDDEKLVPTSFNGGSIQAPKHIYISGGLSSLDSFAFRYVDNKDNSSVDVTVSSVSVTGPSGWVARRAKQSDYVQTVEGKGGTYVFTPFSVADAAYHESYEYAKDKDGKVIYDETTGLPEITGIATPPAGCYFVQDGTYEITTVFSAPNTSNATITTKVHVYNDWGLPGLLNGAVAANRSSNTVDETGAGYLAAYNAAIESTAQLLLPPRSVGDEFDTWINVNRDATNRNGNYNNKYAQYYATLYEQIERIRPHSAGSDADSMRTTVNGVFPYNFNRVSASFDGTTAYYRDYLEYDDSNYSYEMGQRNYTGHTYKAFKDAVNYANGLIDRQHKYINGDPETWEEVAPAERADRVTAYTNAVEDARSNAISSVEAAYAIHRVNLMYGRLRALPWAGDNTRFSKLQWAVNTFGGVTNFGSYSNSSKLAYQRAVAFANATLNESTATPERINRAMNELIIAWRGLMRGADYSDLEAAVQSAKSGVITTVGKGLINGKIAPEDRIDNLAAQQEVYTAESYAALLRAVKAGEKLIDEKEAGEDLSVNDQHIIDSAKTAIENAINALVPYGSGGTDEPSAVLLDEAAIMAINNGHGFYSSVASHDYFPRVDTTVLSNLCNFSAMADGDYQGTTVDGVLYGVPAQFNAGNIEGIFNLENATIEVTEANNGYGTGSLAVIKDLEGNVYKCYLIVFRGDLNGDALLEAADLRFIKFYINGVDGYKFNGADRYMLAAMDADGDGDVGPQDYRTMKFYININQDFDQANGGAFSD